MWMRIFYKIFLLNIFVIRVLVLNFVRYINCKNFEVIIKCVILDLMWV